MFLGVDSSILLNHRSFQTPAASPGFLMVSWKDSDPWKEGSLERMEMEGTPRMFLTFTLVVPNIECKRKLVYFAFHSWGTIKKRHQNSEHLHLGNQSSLPLAVASKRSLAPHQTRFYQCI